MALILSAALLSSTAHAQEETAEASDATEADSSKNLTELMEMGAVALAEESSNKGIALYKQGKYELAIEEFETAHGLVPSVTNLYNIARCYHKLHKYNEAAEHYRKYINQGGPKAAKASSYLQEIWTIPSVVIIESTPVGAEVFIDYESSRRGKTPLNVKLKPGKHVLSIGMAGYVGVNKEIMVPFADEMLVAVYLKEAPKNEKVVPVWEMTPESEYVPPSESIPALPGSELDPSPESVTSEPRASQPPETDVRLKDKGAKHKATALILGGGGFAQPIKFNETGMFGNIGFSVAIGARRSIDIGVGIDGYLASRAKLWSVYGHAGFVATIKRSFYIYGRMGLGATIMDVTAEDLEIEKGLYADMTLRPELGIGWNLRGFNVRVTPLCFALNLGLDKITKGPNGFYFPLVWIGYRI